jgi:hypothetical protein
MFPNKNRGTVFAAGGARSGSRSSSASKDRSSGSVTERGSDRPARPLGEPVRQPAQLFGEVRDGNVIIGGRKIDQNETVVGPCGFPRVRESPHGVTAVHDHHAG